MPEVCQICTVTTPRVPSALRATVFFLLAAPGLALVSCSTPATRPHAPTGPPPAPEKVESLPDARGVATEHFYRGKEFALSGDAACARIEFDRSLEYFREHSRPDDPDDLNFAQQLWESVSLYRTVTEGPNDQEERPPAEETPDNLIAIAPAPTPEEVEKVKAEVPAVPAAAAFDIPVVVNESVLKAIAFYQFRTPQAFAGAVKRSGRYLPLMRRILAEQGLPQDLVYVAMVESAFKPTAHSRKGAHGFWQFIEGTGKRYGLKTTKAIEERSDPVKSTHAAAAYFKELYEMFGDWHLAMAGYDAGEGKILKGLQRTGARDYWELVASNFLHRETRDYVPFVLAAALIARDPARYGFDVVPDPQLDFEIVNLDKPIDLARAAEKMGISLEDLRLLNGELRSRLTPAGVSYPLRIPPGTGEVLRAALSSLPAASAAHERRVTVRKGDTLPKLAARYRVSVADLADWNDLPQNARLRPRSALTLPPAVKTVASRVSSRGASGKIRALPTPAAAVREAASIGLPDGSRAASPPSSPTRVDIPAEGFAKVSSAGKTRSQGKARRAAAAYTVRRGDTLYRIATHFGVTVDAIQKENRLGFQDPLKIGRRLTIPRASGR